MTTSTIVYILDKTKTQENTQDGLKCWLLYLLGVSDKFNHNTCRSILNGLGFRLISHSFIQTNVVGISLDFNTCSCNCHTPRSI